MRSFLIRYTFRRAEYIAPAFSKLYNIPFKAYYYYNKDTLLYVKHQPENYRSPGDSGCLSRPYVTILFVIHTLTIQAVNDRTAACSRTMVLYCRYRSRI